LVFFFFSFFFFFFFFFFFLNFIPTWHSNYKYFNKLLMEDNYNYNYNSNYKTVIHFLENSIGWGSKIFVDFQRILRGVSGVRSNYFPDPCFVFQNGAKIHRDWIDEGQKMCFHSPKKKKKIKNPKSLQSLQMKYISLMQVKTIGLSMQLDLYFILLYFR